MLRNLAYYQKTITQNTKRIFTPIIKTPQEFEAFITAFKQADVKHLAIINLSNLDIRPEQLAKLQEQHKHIRFKLKKTGSLESFKRACIEGFLLSDVKFRLSDSVEIEDFFTLCEAQASKLFTSPMRLDLSGTTFSPEQFKRLLAIIESHECIQHLSLNGCGIRDEHFVPKGKPSKPTTAFKHLRSLSLRDNGIKYQQVVYGAKYLGSLDLSGNMLSKWTYLQLLDSQLKESGASLKKLLLENIDASREPLLNLWSSQSEAIAQTLNTLDLRGSNPALGSIESLPHKMKALRRFALSGLTHLEGENYANGGGSLLEHVLKIERLEDLTLQNCKLSVSGLSKILSTNGIRRLDLSDNPSLFTVKVNGSSDSLAASPALKWKKNEKLRALNLNRCTVRDNELQNIMTHFPGLRELSLAGANISLKKLEALISGLQELRILGLQNAGIANANFTFPVSPRKRKASEPASPLALLKPLIDACNQRESLQEIHVTDMIFSSRTTLKDCLQALVHIKKVNGMPKGRYLALLDEYIQAHSASSSPAQQSRMQMPLASEKATAQSESDCIVSTLVVNPSSSAIQTISHTLQKHSPAGKNVQSDAGSSSEWEEQADTPHPKVQQQADLSVQVQSSDDVEPEHTAQTSVALLALIKLSGNQELIQQAGDIVHNKARPEQPRGPKPRSIVAESIWGKRNMPVLPLANLPSVPESSQEFSPKKP